MRLGFNRLGAFSLKQTAKWTRALTGNQTLTALDLQSNNLGNDGCKAVCACRETSRFPIVR